MQIKKWLKRISLAILALILLLLATGFTYEQVSRLAAERTYSPEGEMVDVGGHRLHVLRQGNGGPTVVFESGLDSFGHLSWYKVEQEVSRFATTVSYDRAGVLWSERGDRLKTGDAMADDLTAVLSKGGFSKPYIIVGHSIAGITLRKFIARNSEDIAGIVFVDASHPDQLNRIPAELNAFPPRWLMSLANSFGIIRLLSPRSFPHTDLDARINTAGPALGHKSISAVIDEMESVGALAVEASQITSFGNIPLIVITGASPNRNDAMPEEYREDMTRIWSGLQRDLLLLSTDTQQILAPESGHYVQLDQPDIVIDAIKSIVETSAGR